MPDGELPDDPVRPSWRPAGGAQAQAGSAQNERRSSTETVSFTTIPGKTYTQAKAFLLEDALRVLTVQGWITVPFRELPKELSAFPDDWQAQIRDRCLAPAANAAGMQMISFTTRKGARYDEVRAGLGRSGLRLVTAQGWVEVPFNDLPKDVSGFSRTMARGRFQQRKER